MSSITLNQANELIDRVRSHGIETVLGRLEPDPVSGDPVLWLQGDRFKSWEDAKAHAASSPSVRAMLDYWAERKPG